MDDKTIESLDERQAHYFEGLVRRGVPPLTVISLEVTAMYRALLKAGLINGEDYFTELQLAGAEIERSIAIQRILGGMP